MSSNVPQANTNSTHTASTTYSTPTWDCIVNQPYVIGNTATMTSTSIATSITKYKDHTFEFDYGDQKYKIDKDFFEQIEAIKQRLLIIDKLTEDQEQYSMLKNEYDNFKLVEKLVSSKF